MSAATEVQAALTEALSDDTADSQAATETTPEVAEALKTVLETETEESSTSEDETQKSTEDDGKEPKTVPYERLSQVVRQKNEISDRLKSLEGQFENVTAREQELKVKLGDLEQDGQILAAIKNLAKDDRYRSHVEVIDRALQGIEEDREEAVATGDNEAESVALKKVQAELASLSDLIKEQSVEDLWSESSGKAKSMLDALPKEYTDQDREVLGQLLNSRVNWSEVEEKGKDFIPTALNAAFAEVIKGYGTPRGALVAKTTEEIESRIPEARLLSPEDQVKNLLEKDYTQVDEKGKPVIGDDEFSSNMAAMLRAVNSDRA